MDSRAGYPLALVPSPVERAPYRSRWSPAKEECLPPPRYAFPHQRQWRIDFGAFYPSAPRQRRPLAILSPEGSRIKRATVFVVTPSGATFHTTTKVSANKLHFLYWPTDFPGAPKVQPAGTYTVFWRAKPHALLGCAGWTVRRGAHA